MGLIENLRAAFSTPESFDSTPAWERDLIDAAYTSPETQTRIEFDYEDVSVNWKKKTSAFEFIDSDGTYVQDNGSTGRRIPMQIFFWGDDHHITADAFEAILNEVGFGQLEHPRYGVIQAVPFGNINRVERLKTGANQTVFQLIFFETTGIVWPLDQDSARDRATSAIDAYNAAAAQQFENQIDLDTPLEKSDFKNKYQTALNTVAAVTGAIAKTNAETNAKFTSIQDSINSSIDILIGDPLTLAFQTKILMQTPARIAGQVRASLEAYGNLAVDIFGKSGTAKANQYDSRNVNSFQNSQLFASGAVAASTVALISNQFTNKNDALLAAETLIEQYEALIEWTDDNYASIGDTINGESTESVLNTGLGDQQLQDAVALTAGLLIQISFTLREERRIILDRDRTMIDLVAEIKDDAPDAYLDEFINDNDLSVEEHLELKRGREIVYYV